MHDPNNELPTTQQEMTTRLNRAASCRVRSPYPASAPGETEASGAKGAPGSAGPGEPTQGEATPSSAPRRRLREPALREKRVHPRYNDTEFALLTTAAHLSRMPVGGYVAETSLAAARSDDPTAAVADYRTMVKTLMAANRQLAAIGRNLNQLNRHLNKDGVWPTPDIVARLLDRIETSVDDVDLAVAQVLSGR
ncbi:plasmid mobilization relaxosome protein MobC [Streptomyces sp. NPDC006984]|uniref:plasmid mobilization relaxosome protein MobC n=1 Tax=Streptomyces sp. NPDC006984 TaxID=3155463 RepID=UPI0033DB1733